MLDFRWKKKFVAPATKVDLSGSAFHVVGSRFHRGDKSTILHTHKWILTAIEYFMKWIEVTPTKKYTESIIIQFLETNILLRFRCPVEIITDIAAAFKSKRMENFFQDYNITFGNFTMYYPLGNELAESSNKSLTRIIKRLLQDNKRTWHKNLIYALWADRVTTKKSISMSPF
jgi:hypothetical protein